MTFRNREQAAHVLADRLEVVHLDHPLVLAIPRGGVPIGAIVARRLRGDFDVVLIHKISPAWQRDLSIGVVAEDGEVFLNRAGHGLGYTGEAPQFSILEQLTKLHVRRRIYTPHQKPRSPAGRSVVIVDDAILTGETMSGAVQDIKKRGAHSVIVAAPVASVGAIERLRAEGVQLCVVDISEGISSLSQIYDDFHRISDTQVAQALRAWSAHP